MKSKITLLILLLSLIGYAQNGINYKAVIKDNLGNVVANSNDIVVQFNILEGATNVYSETHNPESDSNGIIIVNIGEGTLISGDFSTIDWENGNQSLNVQVNTGTGLQDMGTSEFKVVPYALSSGDKSWETEIDNVHVLSKNVGIGTDTPTELLHISDDDKAGINLTVPNFGDTTALEFRNGISPSFYSYYKIQNQSDILSFELDSDIFVETGFQNKMTLSNLGLALENGFRINEFSTDFTLAGNSNTVVPTEAAVKGYVDNATSNTISIPAYAMAIPQSSTIITINDFGLKWENNFSSSAKIAIKKPNNYKGGNVEFSIFYYVLTSSSGMVQFFIRPNSFNNTNHLGDASSITSSGVFVSASSGSGILYEQIITIPANTLTNDWWYIKIQRNIGSFTGDVSVISAALTY